MLIGVKGRNFEGHSSGMQNKKPEEAISKEYVGKKWSLAFDYLNVLIGKEEKKEGNEAKSKGPFIRRFLLILELGGHVSL